MSWRLNAGEVDNVREAFVARLLDGAVVVTAWPSRGSDGT